MMQYDTRFHYKILYNTILYNMIRYDGIGYDTNTYTALYMIHKSKSGIFYLTFLGICYNQKWCDIIRHDTIQYTKILEDKIRLNTIQITQYNKIQCYM